MLLWELLAYGGTPWGAFGVADMVQALRQGERMARPGLFEGEVEDKLYATAIRCWVTTPSKRPPFRQIFDELEVYSKALDVVTAGKNKSSKESAHAGARAFAAEDQPPCSDAVPPSAGASSFFGFEEQANSVPTLDSSSYVEDLPAAGANGDVGQHEPLDTDGYVQEHHALDTNGYVHDLPESDAIGYAEAVDPQRRHTGMLQQALDSTEYVDGHQFDAESAQLALDTASNSNAGRTATPAPATALGVGGKKGYLLVGGSGDKDADTDTDINAASGGRGRAASICHGFDDARGSARL